MANSMFSQFNYTTSVSEKLDNNVNHNAILTQRLYSEVERSRIEDRVKSAFWINPEKISLPNMQPTWFGTVYAYIAPSNMLVLTSPYFTVHVGVNRFYIEQTPEDINDNAIVMGFIPILTALYGMINELPEGIIRNGLNLFGNRNKDGDIIHAYVIEAEKEKEAAAPEERAKSLTAKPIKKATVVDESTVPVRIAKGYRKSYAEIRDALDDYVLCENDFNVLPVMSADLLGYLKIEGGVFIDELTNTQITHNDGYLIVTTDKWKVLFDAKKRSGHKTVYAMLSSMDEKYDDDLRSIASAIHALNNLYKKHK